MPARQCRLKGKNHDGVNAEMAVYASVDYL